jgi:hypothetical protein
VHLPLSGVVMLALLASLLLVGASSSRRHLSAWQQQQQQQRPIDGAHFLGFNVVNLQSGNFSTDSAYVRTTAAQLHAGTLRYPGGNLGDWWDWKTGWCPPPPFSHPSMLVIATMMRLSGGGPMCVTPPGAPQVCGQHLSPGRACSAQPVLW